MRTQRLPGTDLEVSALCLGTDLLGGEIDRHTSYRLLDRYVERGGNWIDTAHIYNDWIPGERSRSEKLIGAWLKERKAKDRVRVATKGAHPALASPHIQRLSSEEIAADVDGSLQALGLDCIDFYWLHRDDRSRPVSDILETMNRQVSLGKIRYFGCSNWRIDRIREAMRYAEAHRLQGFAGSQIIWNAAQMNPAAPVDPTMVAMDEPGRAYYRQAGIGVWAYYALAKGYFAQRDHAKPEELKPAVRQMFHNETTWGRYQRAKTIADHLSVSVAAVALAYIGSHPFPSFPIVGARTVEQLEALLAHADLQLTGDTMRFLEHGG